MPRPQPPKLLTGMWLAVQFRKLQLASGLLFVRSVFLFRPQGMVTEVLVTVYANRTAPTYRALHPRPVSQARGRNSAVGGGGDV